jgi:hypothetical protein
MRLERLDELVLRHLADHVERGVERVGKLGEPFDEARAALEQLGQLVDAQLPR